MVNVRFVYRGAGGHVRIAGDWSQWAPLDMAKASDDQCWVFDVDLQPVQHVAFKFIVDGEWKTAAGYQLVDNGLGDENNTLYIPAVKNEQPAKREVSETVAVCEADVPADEVVDAKVEQQPVVAEQEGGKVDKANQVDEVEIVEDEEVDKAEIVEDEEVDKVEIVEDEEVDEGDKSGEMDESGKGDEVDESDKSNEVDGGDEPNEVTEESNEEDVLGDVSEEQDLDDVTEDDDLENGVDEDGDLDEDESEEVILEVAEAKKIPEQEETATQADVAKRRKATKVGHAIGEEKSGCVLV